MATKPIHIVFKGEGPNLTFVGIEDGQGNSIGVGRWTTREGNQVLIIESLPEIPEEEVKPGYDIREVLRDGDSRVYKNLNTGLYHGKVDLEDHFTIGFDTVTGALFAVDDPDEERNVKLR